jgi:hypothetical protein
VIFDLDIPSRYLRSAPTAVNIRAVEQLIQAARQLFPDLQIDVFLASGSVNARAFMRGRDRHIRLYGGLLRHKAMGFDGLAFALAHEIGHHLGGPPYHFYFDWMSTECQADYWAVVHGVPLLKTLLPSLSLIAAVEQIIAVIDSSSTMRKAPDPSKRRGLHRAKALLALCTESQHSDCYCGDC